MLYSITAAFRLAYEKIYGRKLIRVPVFREPHKAYPDAIIKQEVYTGTKTDGRKVFEQLLKNIKLGDTIVFDSVSRMSRNAEQVFRYIRNYMTKVWSLSF